MNTETNIPLSSTEGAVISANDGLELLLPNPDDCQDGLVPDVLRYLVAVFDRFHHDPHFVAEQLAYFDVLVMGRGPS